MEYFTEERESFPSRSRHANSIKGKNITNHSSCPGKNEYRLIWATGNSNNINRSGLVAGRHLPGGWIGKAI